MRLSFQTSELEWQLKALNKVEKRELQSLNKEHRREQHILARGRHNEMPSLEKVAGINKTKAGEKDRMPDLLKAFEAAQKDRRQEIVIPPLITRVKSRG